MTTINSKSELTLDELDMLCAQKVMGWKLGNHPGYPNSEILWYHSAERPVIDEPDFRPTRNISQAFELIEHSKMRDISFKLERCFDDENYYNCSLLPMVDANVNAETASLAITKACLKAVGVNFES